MALNGLDECYIRPVVYRGYNHVGVDPTGTPIDVAIAAYPWGKYLGGDAITKGVAVKVGTWARMAPNTLPAMAKAGGNYLNSQLLRLEANADGYAETIALDVHGQVSEGSGENLFLVYKGELVDAAARTPAFCSASRVTPSSRWPASSGCACARRPSRARCCTWQTSCSSAARRSR